MKITHTIICIALLPVFQHGYAQVSGDKQRFSLAEAQEYALQHNLTVQNAALDVDAARKRIWENTALGLPQVSAGAGYTNNLKLMTTLIPAEFFQGEPGTFIPVQFGTQHNATANIIATQLLFSGPYIVGLQAASKYKEFTEQSLIKSQSDIKEAVAQSYYSILLAEEGKKAYGKNLESMRQRLEETRAMHEAGFAEETDVDQMVISVTSLETQYEEAEQLAALSYRMLLYQMGYDIHADVEVSQTLDEIIGDLTRNLLQQDFRVEEHIDYKILHSQEQLAMLQMKRYQYEYMPTLTANLSHMQMAMRQEFNFFDFDEKWYPSTTLGFNLSIPVFSSGMRRARIGQSRVEVEKARNLKTTAAEGLELSVRQAKIAFNSAYGKYVTEKNNMELARKIFDRTSVKYNKGMAGSFELTAASDQLTGTHAGYIAAAVELLNAKLKLEKALGQF